MVSFSTNQGFQNYFVSSVIFLSFFFCKKCRIFFTGPWLKHYRQNLGSAFIADVINKKNVYFIFTWHAFLLLFNFKRLFNDLLFYGHRLILFKIEVKKKKIRIPLATLKRGILQVETVIFIHITKSTNYSTWPSLYRAHSGDQDHYSVVMTCGTSFLISIVLL